MSQLCQRNYSKNGIFPFFPFFPDSSPNYLLSLTLRNVFDVNAKPLVHTATVFRKPACYLS